jgi:uracil-DNA glycosylase
VYLALGKTGYDAVVTLSRRGERTTVPPFGHGVVAKIPDPRAAAASSRGGEAWLVGSYHVSQQNTQTGRLTEAMFDEVVGRAVELAGLGGRRRAAG